MWKLSTINYELASRRNDKHSLATLFQLSGDSCAFPLKSSNESADRDRWSLLLDLCVFRADSVLPGSSRSTSTFLPVFYE